MKKSVYPEPPYEHMARAVSRVQLDVKPRPRLIELTHLLLQQHGSPATHELAGGTVRAHYLTVPLAIAARDEALRLDPKATWGLDQTLWFDVEAHYRYFELLTTGRFWVGPAWRAHEAPKGLHRLVTAGDAAIFGDQGHPTTGAMLRAMEAIDLKGRTVFDAGCGTGVLSVAAMKLGAKRVLGVDLAPIEGAQQLAKAHRVKVSFERKPVQQVTEAFDVILCNMNMDALDIAVPVLATRAWRVLILTGWPLRYRSQVLGRYALPAATAYHPYGGYEAATFIRRESSR